MSFGIAVKGLDSAGGIQLAGGQSGWTVEGADIVLLGDPVAGHGLPPHAAPVMSQGSSWMTINGTPVVRQGHLASCGHPSTGRSWFTLPD
jgi:uncharacterized Zn-binding protein involved in type VI secretion